MKKQYDYVTSPTTPTLDIHRTDDGKWSVSVGGKDIGTRDSFTACLELYESYMAEHEYM